MLSDRLGRGSPIMDALRAATIAAPAANSQASGPLTSASFLTLGLDSGLSYERVLTAGAGLSGTDAGPNTTYTLDVNVGSGIQIVADAVAVDSTVARSTWPVNAGAGLTGGGNLASGGITIDVAAGDASLTVAANDVRVNQGFGFAWTGAQTWASTATFNGVAAFAGGIGSSLIPSLTDTYDLGSSLKLWRKGWLSELDAILFAQNVVSVIGGWLMVSKGEGAAGADIASGDTTVNLGSTAGIAVNDFILFRAAGQVEYMQVTAGAGPTWTVTRNLDGSGANAWPMGSVFVNLGYNGKGRLELNAFDTPRISLLRQGTSYNTQTEQIRIGDLNGNWGYGAETYGLALGDYAASLPNITIDPTNGLRIRTFNGTPVIQIDTSGNADITNKLRLPGASSALTIGSTPPTAANAGTGIWLDRTGFYSLNAGTYQVKIDATNGILYAGGGTVKLDVNGLSTGGNGTGIQFYGDAAFTLSRLIGYVGAVEASSEGQASLVGQGNATAPGAKVWVIAKDNGGTQRVDLTLRAVSGTNNYATLYAALGTFLGLTIGNSGAPNATLDVRGTAIFGGGTAALTRQVEIQNAAPYMKFTGHATGNPHTIGVDGGGFIVFNDTASVYDLTIANGGSATFRGDVFALNKAKGLQASINDIAMYDCSANLNLTTALQDVAGVTTGAFTPAANEYALVHVMLYINQAAGTAACTAGDVLNGTLLVNGAAQTRVMQGTATGATGFACYKGVWLISLNASTAYTIKLQAKNTTGARGLVNTATHMMVWRIGR